MSAWLNWFELNSYIILTVQFKIHRTIQLISVVAFRPCQIIAVQFQAILPLFVTLSYIGMKCSELTATMLLFLLSQLMCSIFLFSKLSRLFSTTTSFYEYKNNVQLNPHVLSKRGLFFLSLSWWQALNKAVTIVTFTFLTYFYYVINIRLIATGFSFWKSYSISCIYS